MSNAVVAYILAALCLFGALFAAFALAGIGMRGPLQVTGNIQSRDATAPARTAQPPQPQSAPALATPLDYPDLEIGRTYQISHPTTIYSTPSPGDAETQSLPQNGYFKVEAKEQHANNLWYRVIVNDGSRDYTMYVLAEDLNFKRVVPQYSAQEQDAARREAALRIMRKIGEQRRERREAAAAVQQQPAEPEPVTFAEWWSGVVAQVGGVSIANLIVAGLAAAVTTFAALGSIALAVWVRRTHAWDRPLKEEIEDSSERGSEFYEQNDPGSSSGAGFEG